MMMLSCSFKINLNSNLLEKKEHKDTCKKITKQKYFLSPSKAESFWAKLPLELK